MLLAHEVRARRVLDRRPRPRAPKKTTPWFGVRNYLARNFMRDAMRVGDGVLFYHSSCPEPGIAGLAKVASAPYPDATQFDPQEPVLRPQGDARRSALDAGGREAREEDAPHAARGDARAIAPLADMITLQRGNRLSITPVTAREWHFIVEMLGG